MRVCCADGCSMPVFGTDKNTRKGYCRFHQRNRTDLKKGSKKTPIKTEEDFELREFYEDARIGMVGVCCNCGNPSSKRSDRFWKWSVAHILPKNIFPSIRAHPANKIELCIACHTLYDRSWDDASKMKCFPIAVEKFKLFYSEIDEGEKRRIPTEFLNNIKANDVYYQT